MKTMNKLFTLAVLSASVAITGCGSTAKSTNTAGLTEGTTVYTVANLHADAGKNKLYAMNYQLPILIPICTEFVITDTDTKAIELSKNGIKYTYYWDKYTRGAGQTLSDNFAQFFDKSCQAAKTKTSSLSEIDQKGIKKGKAMVGMSRAGILLAMGRPPIHATPDLNETAWTYWINKWAKNIIEFDEKGIVNNIQK